MDGTLGFISMRANCMDACVRLLLLMLMMLLLLRQRRLLLCDQHFAFEREKE